MATKNPRINVVLEKPIYESIETMAKRDKTSLSSEVNYLVREAIELYEDTALAKIADSRARNPKKKKLLTHKEVWK
jgi:hypothetical protein